VFYGIPFIIVVGWFSSRLLVHWGWGRSFVAGFSGWVFGVSIAVLTRTEHQEHPPAEPRAAVGPVLGVISMFPRSA
jgi:hypothetical protein